MTTPPNLQTPKIPITIARFIVHFIFGVFLPAFTLGFEWVTHLSDEIYVDPIPSLFHVIMVGLVPAIILLNLIRCLRDTRPKPWDLHLNAFCIAISGIYAVIYIPISPFAAFGIMAYGLGFLPLSPIIALFVAYRVRKEMKRQIAPEWSIGWRHFLTGFFTGGALLLIAAIPGAITEYAMSQYAKSSVTEDTDAVQLLRKFGNEQTLLKACYRRSQPVFFWGGTHSALETSEARKLYYRVTGTSFNDSKKSDFMPMVRGDSWDGDLGGEQVGQRIEDLHLEESRIDGLLQTEVGTGYVEWTMVFRNDHSFREHEARMLISMPRGGVASRVTLWVNGEPREAAFGSKAKVRSAYQKVAVQQRRDPILVNWAGPDLLLAQCFPIPSDGGHMKVRIGISFPLESDASNSLQFNYPTIVAENFNISDQLKHSVWYEEKIGDVVTSHPVSDMTTMELASTKGSTAKPATLFDTSFTSRHATKDNKSLQLTPQQATLINAAQPDAVVIDGSRAMHTHSERIAHWLSKYNGVLQIYFASDEVQTFQGNGAECAKWLQQQKFIGGQDNVPALVQALRALQPEATANTPKSIYWFSGPQPIQLTGTEPIKQLYERRALNLNITSCLTSRDYNTLYELAPLAYVDNLYLNEDGVLANPTIQFKANENGAANNAGSSHPHRVWLANEIRELTNQTYRNQASIKSGDYQQKISNLANQAAEAYLVTQLSGAVVLETDRQYKENDLEPGDPNRTPAIPEAKHYALMLGIGALLTIGGHRFYIKRKELKQ